MRVISGATREQAPSENELHEFTKWLGACIFSGSDLNALSPDDVRFVNASITSRAVTGDGIVAIESPIYRLQFSESVGEPTRTALRQLLEDEGITIFDTRAVIPAMVPVEEAFDRPSEQSMEDRLALLIPRTDIGTLCALQRERTTAAKLGSKLRLMSELSSIMISRVNEVLPEPMHLTRADLIVVPGDKARVYLSPSAPSLLEAALNFALEGVGGDANTRRQIEEDSFAHKFALQFACLRLSWPYCFSRKQINTLFSRMHGVSERYYVHMHQSDGLHSVITERDRFEIGFSLPIHSPRLEARVFYDPLVRALGPAHVVSLSYLSKSQGLVDTAHLIVEGPNATKRVMEVVLNDSTFRDEVLCNHTAIELGRSWGLPEGAVSLSKDGDAILVSVDAPTGKIMLDDIAQAFRDDLNFDATSDGTVVRIVTQDPSNTIELLEDAVATYADSSHNLHRICLTQIQTALNHAIESATEIKDGVLWIKYSHSFFPNTAELAFSETGSFTRPQVARFLQDALGGDSTKVELREFTRSGRLSPEEWYIYIQRKEDHGPIFPDLYRATVEREISLT